MADIKLQLSGLGIELDVPQDKDFPLSLNFTSATMKDIESRSSNYSLEFRIPATKRNKTSLGHINSSNVEDGNNIKGKNDCVVLVDGLPVFSGQFKILGIVNDRFSEEFNCIILGDESDWINGMRNKTPRDYEWTTSPFTYSKDNVESSWTNDYSDGYTFPLINYGAWNYADRIIAEDFRPSIFLRTLFKKAFEDEDYTIQMDTDENDFFHSTNNPDIDKIVIPYVGSGFRRSESAVAEDEFIASEINEHSYSADFDKKESREAFPLTKQRTGTYKIRYPFLDHGTDISGATVRRIYLPSSEAVGLSLGVNSYLVIDPETTYYDNNGNTLATPTGRVNRIVGTGNIAATNDDLSGLNGDNTEHFNVKFIDIITHEVNDNLGLTYVNGEERHRAPNSAYMSNKSRAKPFIINVVETTGGDEDGEVIVFNSINPSAYANFNLTNNKYIANDYANFRFNFSATFTAKILKNGITEQYNTGLFNFKILHKSGSIITEIGQEILNATETSNIDSYKGEFRNKVTKEVSLIAEYRLGFDSDVVSLAPNDEVWVEVEIEHENAIEAEANEEYNTVCVISETTFKSVPQIDIIEGNTFNIQDVLDDRYKTIDYIKGTIHAFNLMIQTDKYSKRVIIKSRDKFFDKTSAIDWTDKIDNAQSFDLEYLDTYNRYLDFGFQPDSADGYVTEINKLHNEANAPYGSYTEDIGERFEDDRQQMYNPLFAYTHHIADRTTGGELNKSNIYLSRLWKEYSPNSIAPAKSFNFRPRLLFFSNEAQEEGAFFKYYDSNKTTIPTAVAGNRGTKLPNLDVDLHLSYNNSSSENGLVSSYYETSVNIIEKGTIAKVSANLTKKDIQTLDLTKRIYLSYPEELRGYWLIDSISNYIPSNETSVNVELIKDDSYATRDVAFGSLQPDDDKIGDLEWSIEGIEAIDIGNPNTGGGKWTAQQIQDAINKGMTAKGSGGKGWHQQSNAKELMGAVGVAHSYTNGTPAKFHKGQPDFQVELDTIEQHKIDAYKNSKNAVGIEGITALARKNYNTSFKIDNINPSMVQKSVGNKSIGSGNTVLGKGNVGAGSFQTVAGKYNKPSLKEAFSVGTGKNALERNTAFSVGLDGVVREGGGVIVEEIEDEIRTIYEEINGELVKITL